MYAVQDGPDFYIFEDGAEEPRDVVHSPYAFNDGDMETARAARAWFLARHPETEVL